MKINTKIRYGLRTMIEIACSTNQEGVLQKDIAKNQNISLKYLDSIIASLKLKQLIINYKGKGSGYVLTKPAEKISMMDIYTAFEKIEVVECINNQNYCIRSTHDCKANNYWMEFSSEFAKMLSKKTLQEIIETTRYECLECQNFENEQL